MSDGPESEQEMAPTLTLPLSPEARAVIERFLFDAATDDLATEFRAVRDLLSSVGVYSSGLGFLRWLLAQDDALRSRPCPHVVAGSEGTHHCALGQTTAEADRALARIGALFLAVYGTRLRLTDDDWIFADMALTEARDNTNDTTLARARALLAETQEGGC